MDVTGEHTCCLTGPLGSVAFGRVDDVEERLAGEMALQIATEEGDAALGSVGLVGRSVRADDRVWQVPERAVRRQGLLVKGVQEGAAKAAFPQGRGQRGVVDHR